MRYVLISGEFRHGGGMDRPNYELACYLAETEGAETHLVAYQVAQELVAQPNIIWHKVAKPLNSALLGEPFLSWQGKRVARQVSQQGPVRVVANGGNCPWPDVNWVHYIHAAYRPQVATGWVWRAKNALGHRKFLADEKLAFQRARLIITDSDYMRQVAVESLGVPAERVRTVYYGIDADVFRPPTRAEKKATQATLGWPTARLAAMFVGALGDRRKGFDVLFAAWQELCQDPAWDVDLVVAGAGSELENWRARSQAVGLGERIRLPGFVNNMRQMLWASDLLVSPTRYEPYGLGVHEALCCGLPAFVTRTAGIAERYPLELQDWLIEFPPTSADVAARLRRWRADLAGQRARAESFGAVLRQRSWRDMAREMVTLIKQMPMAEEIC